MSAGRRKPNVWLEIRRGSARQRMRPVAGPVYLIGAAPDCDLVLADPQFPAVHAYLLIGEGRVSLRRLADGPEITVDGRPVEAVELLNGDRLRTGPYEFHLHVGTAPDGPEGLTNVREKPHAPHIRPSPLAAPVAMVRALLSEVRGILATTDAPAAAPSPSLPPTQCDAA